MGVGSVGVWEGGCYMCVSGGGGYMGVWGGCILCAYKNKDIASKTEFDP